MATMRIFVSHSHQDEAFCHAIVAALRTADTDVWYDEHNLGSGQLLKEIQRELRSRPVFIVILSPAAMQSTWVQDEAHWAYNLYKRDVTRTILPITAVALNPNDFDDWLFIEDYKRIEAPGLHPLAADEAAQRLLRALALTPRGQVPAPTAPQPQESADELIARGKALFSQKRTAEAVPLFQRATEIAPKHWEGWAMLGRSYASPLIMRYEEALQACDVALQFNPNALDAWHGKGNALWGLRRYQEALAAYDYAIVLDPNYAVSWHNKAKTLQEMGRTAEAQQAEARAKELGWKG